MWRESRPLASRGSSLPEEIAPSNHWLWLGPLLLMAIIGLYVVVRYTGQWAEADSATFAKLIRAFVAEGRIVPPSGDTYPNGYVFQALSSFIVALTGADVATLQQLVYPLVAIIVVAPAWVLYRELTESAAGAALATLLLCTQPEFLFMILRSSHEKFTRTLMFLCLFVLIRSFKAVEEYGGDRPWLRAKYVAVFTMMLFALIGSNNLIANSFIFGIVIAMVVGGVLERRTARPAVEEVGMLRRFVYVVLIGLALVYLMTFYIYPPAQHDLLVLQTLTEKIAALLLDVQKSGSTNAYLQVQAGWVSLPAYFLVSTANWIILGVSMMIWCYQAWRWLGRGDPPKTLSARLLWLFYGAFAAQGVASIVADASGALGSNLQHRLFPSFSMLAVAVVAAGWTKWRPGRSWGPVRVGVLRAVLAIALGGIAILSIFKATNEPLVSNKWTFYRPAEMAALQWTDSHLTQSPIWTEFDERLVVAYDTAKGDSANQNTFEGYGVRTTTRTRVMTDITRLRASRLNQVLPLPPDAYRVYDNGSAEVYHLRPETPFQP